ncbi:adenosine receptor A3 [Ornithorhynchus anatinus]|uniref:Adenosine receptor A3 n=1 Tax=Ornithorhynchus anatinus TaxID=9258 RepID=F7BKB8_ORNAN|nr:adenosine receptor A3 [Ornithorhynchus anatinus]
MSENSTALSVQDAAYIAVESVIGLCSVVGNALVIWVVWLNPSLQNTTFYFIISLALADIAVGILVIPLAIVVSLGVPSYFYNCLFMSCLLLVFTHASIMSLLAIAVDRYLRVKLTIRYKRITTHRRIWMALILCWLISFLVGLVPMFGWNTKLSPGGPGNSSHLPCKFLSVMSMDYMVYFSFFAWILIPLIIMCIIYLDIFYIIRTKLSQNMSGSKEAGTFYGKEFKTAKSLALVLFLFAASWLPLSIINCVLYFFPQSKPPMQVIYLGILLSHANSMMNPIVYACKIKKFKETYLLIFRSYILCQSSNSTEPTVDSAAYRPSRELTVLRRSSTTTFTPASLSGDWGQ